MFIMAKVFWQILSQITAFTAVQGSVTFQEQFDFSCNELYEKLCDTST